MSKRRNIAQSLPTLLPYQQGIFPNAYELLMKQPVSQDTLKSYRLNMDNVRKVFNVYNFDILFTKPEKRIKKITATFGEDTYYTQKMLNVVNKYLTLINDSSVKEKYGEALLLVNNNIQGKRMNNQREGKVAEEWVPYKKIVAEIPKLLKDNDNQAALLLMLYTSIPPVRNDYWDLKVRNYNPQTDNYYGSKVIVLNHYKTAKTYGRLIIKIPSTLRSLIKKNIDESDYLFKTNSGIPFATASNFTKYFQSIFTDRFGKKTTFQIMRNIYITHLAENKSMTLKEIKEVNHIMGHNLEQSMLYRKFVEKPFTPRKPIPTPRRKR